MVAILVTVLAWAMPVDQDRAQLTEAIKLRDERGQESGLVVMIQPMLDAPKTAPKYRQWSFDYLTAGYVPSQKNPGKSELRFLCYSQTRRPTNDPAPGIVQVLLRLWSYNRNRLKIDHSEAYASRQVHLYLCDGGDSGGEQRFGEDRYIDEGTGRAVSQKVNTIYIYDMPTFTKDRVEMLREIAHEYGHATLPPIGPFSKPEDWANGDLGERLYLRWLFEDLVVQRLQRGDALGVTTAGLEQYLKSKSDPLIRAVATNGPNLELMGKKGEAAMNAYLGLALYAERILPASLFARALALTGSTKALDFARAVVDAAGEQQWTLRVPYGFEGKRLWIPAGKSKVTGASVLSRKGDWVQVQAGRLPITVG
ncbi:MAG TPA: hypothetical protein PLL78_04240 [Fimbriimonadaceae bacterium]|nr:hypothetical protein [Fimbriimonadaceae bacterium]HRJ95872.1 hypothetical protein [Fimbriimonadaceae bacterium]